MRLLITGSKGFLGGALARFATRQGHQVLGVGRSSSGRPGEGLYLEKDLCRADLSIIIRDFAPDAIFHAAGPASVAASFNAPLTDFYEGVVTWVNVLDEVRRSNLKPLVLFPSSAAVYGDPQTVPITENTVVSAVSPYGFHKIMCEVLAREYSKCFGIDITIFRLFSIFGMDQRRLLVWELYKRFTGADEVVWLDGTGKESRDYLDIEDASCAVLQVIEALAAQTRETPDAAAQHLIVNIGSGNEIGVLELARYVGRLLGSQKAIRCRGVQRRGEPLRWRADISLLRALIPQWVPKPLSLAVRECVAGWQSENG